MDLGLDGQTAIVTASSSGLGKASATALSREGANVVISGRTPDRLESAAEEIRSHAEGEVVSVETDITKERDIENLVEATVHEFGGVDHLVTSAGGVPSGPFGDITQEEWYDAYDMLVMSVQRAVTNARPYLEESDAGTITAITSTSVAEPIEGLVLSNAVRRGVIGLVKTLSKELAPEIRSNAVLPGPFQTPRMENLIQASLDRGEIESYEEGLSGWADPIPLDRTGDPIELGDAVAFLASEHGSFINGVALPVDGGRLDG
jgi:NAD(P)-dependent dehydrogenase (short-subunit alcohol dehydrogenase family)